MAERVAGIRRALGVLIGIGLGGMLLFAALLKAADPPLFVDEIRGYGILPSMSGLAAYVLVIVEVVIGLLLVLQILQRPALVAFAALMLVFIGTTAYAWSQGNTEGCGCFGRLSSRPPGEVIIEDSIYVALAAIAFWASPCPSWPRGTWGRIRLAFLAVAAPVLILSPWIAPRMPIDSWVTPLRPGFSIENLAADDLRIPLSEGKLLLAFVGEECERCVESLPHLNEVASAEDGPRVVAVYAGDRQQARAWTLKHTPRFLVAHASKKSLRQYYRTLPVFILVEEGTVGRVWWGRAPGSVEVLGRVG